MNIMGKEYVELRLEVDGREYRLRIDNNGIDVYDDGLIVCLQEKHRVLRRLNETQDRAEELKREVETSERELYTLRDVSRITGIRYATLRLWKSLGKLKMVGEGKHAKVPKEEVLRLIEANKPAINGWLSLSQFNRDVRNHLRYLCESKRLNAEKDATGRWRIKPSELYTLTDYLKESGIPLRKVAEKLHVNPARVYGWAERELIPTHKVRGRVYVPREFYESLPEKTVSVRKAAERLGVSTVTVYKWIKEGRIGALRIKGADTLVPIAEIERLLSESKSS